MCFILLYLPRAYNTSACRALVSFKSNLYFGSDRFFLSLKVVSKVKNHHIWFMSLYCNIIFSYAYCAMQNVLKGRCAYRIQFTFC